MFIKTQNRQRLWFRLLCAIVTIAFGINTLTADLAQALSVNGPQTVMMVPPGTLMPSSQAFSFPSLKAISIDPQNPFKLDFVLDDADQARQPTQDQLKLLVKYFLSFLALPESELWVNLSPYEKNRIIAPEFENTNAGRDMLVQDYTLKQLASSLTYPDHELGRFFWKKVFDRAKSEYGTTDIPVNAFNKVWVVPDKAVVYEENGSALIGESRLKVLVEEDYLSTLKHKSSITRLTHPFREMTTELTREIIIPELEREVNEGRYFAPLRQMYHSLILAIWFKRKLRNNLINEVYANRQKTAGITLNEKQIKERIYDQYLKAFKKGVYNYIKEEYDPITQETIPRKYFSGGFSFADTAMHVNYLPATHLNDLAMISKIRALGSRYLHRFTVVLSAKGVDNAMLIKAFSSKKTPRKSRFVRNMLWTLALVLVFGVAGTFSSQAATTQFEVNPNGKVTAIIPENGTPGQMVLDVLNANDNDYHSNKGPVLWSGWSKFWGQVQAANHNLPDTRHFKKGDRIDVTPLVAQGPAARARLAGQTVAAPERAVPPVRTSEVRPVIVQEPPQVAADQRVSVLRQEAGSRAAPAPSITQTRIDANQGLWNLDGQQSFGNIALDLNPQNDILSTYFAKQFEQALVHGTGFAIPAAPLAAGSSGSGSKGPPDHGADLQQGRTVAAGSPVTTDQMGVASTLSTVTQGPAGTVSATYPFSQTATPEKLSWKASGEGIVTLKPAGFYAQGSEIGGITKIEVKQEIDREEATLISQKEQLAHARSSLAPSVALQNIQESINATQARLADLRIKVIKIITPFDLTILPSNQPATRHVNKDDKLFEYLTSNIVSFDLTLPASFDPNSISDFQINGEHIISIPIIKATSLDGKNQSLHVVVRANKPVPATEVSVKIMTADIKNDLRLSGIEVGASTITYVDPFEADPVTTSLSGPVRDLVVEGETVVKGQALAIVGDEQFINKYNSIIQQLKDVRDQLKDETVIRLDRTGLIEKEVALKSDLDSMRRELKEMVIVARHNGVVRSIRHDRPQTQAGGTIMELSPGTVILNMLVDHDNPVQVGSPFIYRTQSGDLLAGTVQSVSDTIPNPTMDLNSRYVTAQVFDPEGQLGANQWGRVMWPKTQAGKDKILAVIAGQNATEIKPGEAGGAPTEEFYNNLLPEGHMKKITVTSRVPGPTTVSYSSNLLSSGTGGINFDSLIAQVRANPLTAFASVIEENKARASEGLLDAPYLKLQLGAERAPDGTYQSVVGVAGGIGNTVSASVRSGSELGLADQIFGQVWGNLWSWISGQHALDVKDAKQTTANLGVKAKIDRTVRETQAIELALRIVEIDHNIAVASDQVSAIQARSQRAQTMASGGWENPLVAGNARVSAITSPSDLQDLQRQKTDLTLKLQGLLGARIDPNQPLSFQFPMGNIEPISAEQQNQLWTSVQTYNLDLQYARGLIQSKGYDFDIEKKNGIELGLGSEYASSNLTDPQIDPSSIRTTSAVTRGSANFVGLTIPIIDGTHDIKMQLVQYDQDKVAKAFEQTQLDVQVKFQQAVSKVNSLAPEIRARMGAVNEAKANASSADSNSNYAADQVIAAHQNLITQSKALNSLITEYMEAWSVLRSLGATDANGPLMPSVGGGSPVVSTPMITTSFTVEVYEPPPAVDLSVVRFDNVKPLPRSNLRPGQMEYPKGAEGFKMFIEAASNPVEFVTSTLINDSDAFARSMALNYLTTDALDTGGFDSAVDKIFKDSKHPDVIEGLLKFMVERHDHDIRFLFQKIEQAQDKDHPNQLVADLVYQSLHDIIINHPDVLDSISANDLGNNGEKIFLTFFLREPADSIATLRVLQSNIYGVDDLARMSNELTNYANSHSSSPGVEKVRKLSALMDDVVLRQAALDSIDQVLRPGDFEGPNGFLNRIWLLFSQRDLRTPIQIQADAQQNRLFLNSSPQWRQMEGNVNPRVLERAREALKNRKAENMVSLSSNESPFYDFADAQSRANGLAYFQSLGLEAQKQYIAKAAEKQDIAVLARIAGMPTVLNVSASYTQELRSAAVEALKTTREGRSMGRQVYLNSQNSQVNALFESSPWVDLMKQDVEYLRQHADAQDPANFTLRGALDKMSQNAKDPFKKQFFRDMELATMSDVELHAFSKDSLEDARINSVARPRALEAYDQSLNLKLLRWVPGHPLQSTEAQHEIREVRRIMASEHDPRKVEAAIAQLRENAKSSDAKSTLDWLASTTDKFAQKIRSNDQDIPWYPVSSFASLVIFGGAFVLYYAITALKGRLLRLLRRNEKRMDKLKRIAPKLLDASNMNINGNIDGTSLITAAKPNIEESVEKPLESWRRLVVNWTKRDQIDPKDLLNDVNTILMHSSDIIRLMPYQTSLIQPERRNQPAKNGNYFMTFAYFNFLAVETLDALIKKSHDRNLSNSERMRLQDSANVLLDQMEYASEFLYILQSRSVLDKANGYKLGKDSWVEKGFFSGLMRWVLMYRKQIDESKEELRERIPRLITKGQKLVPGLYQVPEELINKSYDVLEEVVKKGSSLGSAGGPPEQGYFFALRSITTKTLGLLPLAFQWNPLGILGVIIYWDLHLAILKKSGLKELSTIINGLRNEKIQTMPSSWENQTREQSIVSLARLESKEAVEKEKATVKPNVDGIVVIAKNQEDVVPLESYLESSKGKVVRNDIPLKVFYSPNKGSGSIYLDAMREYKNLYPNNWHNSKIMFVMAGEKGAEENALLDLAIANGYRLAAAFPGPGHILLNTRDAYFGPMPHVLPSGLIIMTAWVNGKSLSNFGWVNTNLPKTGIPEVLEILQKLGINKLRQQEKDAEEGRQRPQSTVEHMKKIGINLSNDEIRQFQVFSGMVVIPQQAVDSIDSIDSELQAGNFSRTIPINLGTDILDFWAKLKDIARLGENKTHELKSFINWRSSLPDVQALGLSQQEIESLLERMYGIVDRHLSSCPVTINAFGSSPNLELFIHIPDKISLHDQIPDQETARFRSALDRTGGRQLGGQVNAAQMAERIRPPGGIDFSTTEETTLFKQKNELLSLNDPTNVSVAQVLKAFKGFDFEIIGYQPVENPIKLFLGSSANDSGSWFSNREFPINNPAISSFVSSNSIRSF